MSVAAFEPLNIIDVVYYHKSKSDLHLIKELSLCDQSSNDTSPRYAPVRVFLAEMIYRLISSEGGGDGLFRFLSTHLPSLSTTDVIPTAVLWVLMRMLRYLGICPLPPPMEAAYFDLNAGEFGDTPPVQPDARYWSGESSHIFYRLLQMCSSPIEESPLNHEDTTEAHLLLFHYLRFHIKDFQPPQSYEMYSLLCLRSQ